MSYQEDLILSIYDKGEPGLAMGNKPLREGDGGSPYTAPPKENPGPFVPAPKRDLAMDPFDPDSSIMNYVTEQGFFLDGQGRAYMQGGGKFQDAGEYDVDIHGLSLIHI